mmetsp:Transcript_3443/g.6193  ORF Transcript_3443/g.6193 Transcript_3443/m.6193 type:complete len:319 (+) Transcript_3443:506-1462(+)
MRLSRAAASLRMPLQQLSASAAARAPSFGDRQSNVVDIIQWRMHESALQPTVKATSSTSCKRLRRQRNCDGGPIAMALCTCRSNICAKKGKSNSSPGFLTKGVEEYAGLSMFWMCSARLSRSSLLSNGCDKGCGVASKLIASSSNAEVSTSLVPSSGSSISSSEHFLARIMKGTPCCWVTGEAPQTLLSLLHHSALKRKASRTILCESRCLPNLRATSTTSFKKISTFASTSSCRSLPNTELMPSCEVRHLVTRGLFSARALQALASRSWSLAESSEYCLAPWWRCCAKITLPDAANSRRFSNLNVFSSLSLRVLAST